MKTITYEDFVSFKPCWLTDGKTRIKHAAQLARYRKMRDEWSALEILRLDEVEAKDRLWLALREELIDAPILHEFACRCAERAIARIDKPDERSVAAIEAKRKWLRGEISNKELYAAWGAAVEAHWVAYAFVDTAYRAAADAAQKEGWRAALDATRSARNYVEWTAGAAEKKAETEWQAAELMRML